MNPRTMRRANFNWGCSTTTAWLALALVLGLGVVAPKAWAQPDETHEGELEVIVEDYEDHAVTRHFTLTSTGDRLELVYPNEARMPSFQTGERVRARGRRSGHRLLLADGDLQAVTVTAAAPLAGSTGPQNVLVILVNFLVDTRQPYTPAQVQSLTFDTTNRWYQEVSFGQTSLTGQVAGWYTVDVSTTGCQYTAIASAAKNAATAAGININQFNRFVYVFPRLNSCGWAGLGTIGGNPSSAWINGSLSLRALGHELGHNYGLRHAKSIKCGSMTFSTSPTSCSLSEYGDPFDIMGGSSNHFNAKYKEQLGWMTTQIVTANGTYDIHPIEVSTSPVKGLKVAFPTPYFLEYRQKIGFDSGITGTAVSGLLVHWNAVSYSALLDMEPATTSFSDAALVPGKTFVDPSSGGTITTLSTSPVSIRVQIQFMQGSLCDINHDQTTNVTDVQLTVNQALGVMACTADINLDSRCDVIDVQRVVNAALGGPCVSP